MCYSDEPTAHSDVDNVKWLEMGSRLSLAVAYNAGDGQIGKYIRKHWD